MEEWTGSVSANLAIYSVSSFDWDSMNRLHEKGFIGDPIGKAKSVVLTEKGLAEAERLFKAMFTKK